ncbi:MAG: electron transfer flavoprotein subunit beta/FixA family protein [Acidobacteria bacterium]|nr:electron transfer flavoprotein subunit beta/FixA family protein [Acidobacteriota bacterium]
MKIVVCMKQTPSKDSILRTSADGAGLDLSQTEFETNEPDSYALEEALRLKDEHSAEVVAITAGAANTTTAIRDALAKGADRGILIEDDLFAGVAEPLATAIALAVAIRKESPDLVLTGLQSDDVGFGQTGVVLAELLGLPHATLIVELRTDGATLDVKRELEAGWFQRLQLPLPALLTIQSGINKPRYATLMGIKKAKKKPLDRLPLGELDAAVSPGLVVQRLYAPTKQKTGTLLTGTPAEQAAQLLTKLREAKVL